MKDTLQKVKAGYLERKAVFKKYGYDFDREYTAIIKQAVNMEGEILDIGTGKGYFALALAAQKKMFTTIDNAREAKNIALLNLRAYGLERFIHPLTANAQNMPFKSDKFSLIFSVNALHHFWRPLLVFSECLRVIKPGGKIIISDFSPQGFKMVSRIHEAEGNTHDDGPITILDAADYFKLQGYNPKVIKGKFQHILVVENKKGELL